MRKRTGLRNRFRAGGRSTYAARRRINGADRYSRPDNGRMTDIIGGRLLSYWIGGGLPPRGYVADSSE